MSIRLPSNSRYLPSWQLFRRPSATHSRAASRSSPGQVELNKAFITPTQLLRFSLTGTTQSQASLKPGELGSSHGIGDLFEQWAPNTSPPADLRLKLCRPVSYRDVPWKSLQHGARRIRHIHAFIERYVTNSNCAAVLQASDCVLLRRALKRCEQHSSYGDILCTVNGIIARLGNMELPVSAAFYVLGMRYACLSISAPALHHHLEGYHYVSSEALSAETSVSLVNCLFYALQGIQFECPDFSMASMLKVVTGEGSGNDQYKLHDSLFWAHWDGPTDSIYSYILLLTKLKSNTILRQMLDRSLRELFPDSRFPIQAIYSCVMGLLDEREPDKAVAYLKQISERCDGSLPGISKFHGIQRLLAYEEIHEVLPDIAGELEYAEILQRELLDMEIRLGIKWQPQKLIHTSITDQRCVASEEPLFSHNGDCTGFNSVDRLIAEIRAFGCSREIGKLSRIAELLDEHDGTEIPVTLSTFEDEPSDLAWYPQHSPIEFSSASAPSQYGFLAPRPASTLGLLRGRFDSEGTPLEYERSLRLVQLGYLVMRRRDHKHAPGVSNVDKRREWEETGHIVAWDRVAGEFLAVFVGKGYGLVDPGPVPKPLQPPAGLRTVEGICVPGYPSGPGAGSSVCNSRFHFEPELL